MIILGLTGGIACGKSAICSYMTRLGAKYVSADKLAHFSAMPGGELWQVYVDHFGEQALMPNQTLNRKAIAAVVFNDENERRWLDGATHPVLRRQMESAIAEHQKIGTPVLILDVPLLYEAGWDDLAESVWVIYASEEAQIRRMKKRPNVKTEENARLRIAAQMSLAEKCERADVVIDNSGIWEDTVAQIHVAYAPILMRVAERYRCMPE